jgi:hypothetical protein
MSLEFPLVGVAEVRSKRELYVSIRHYTDKLSPGGDWQVPKVALAHHLASLADRRIDVDRMRKRRHKGDDLWIALHSTPRSLTPLAATVHRPAQRLHFEGDAPIRAANIVLHNDDARVRVSGGAE